MTFKQRIEGVQELNHVGYLAERHFILGQKTISGKALL